jgi:hypothetical protein
MTTHANTTTTTQMTTRAQRIKSHDPDYDEFFTTSVMDRLTEEQSAYFPPEGFNADLYQCRVWLLLEKYVKDKSSDIIADMQELRDGKTFSPDDALFFRLVPTSEAKQEYKIYLMDLDGTQIQLAHIKTAKGEIEFARTKNERLVAIIRTITEEFKKWYLAEMLVADSIERKKRGRATNDKSKRPTKRRRYDEAEEDNEDGEDSEEEDFDDEFENCEVVNNNYEVDANYAM